MQMWSLLSAEATLEETAAVMLKHAGYDVETCYGTAASRLQHVS